MLQMKLAICAWLSVLNTIPQVDGSKDGAAGNDKRDRFYAPAQRSSRIMRHHFARNCHPRSLAPEPTHAPRQRQP